MADLPRSRALVARLRELRTEVKVSGRELARRINRPHSTVHRWDRGLQVPKPEEVTLALQAIDAEPATIASLVSLAESIAGAGHHDWFRTGPGITDQLIGVMDCERSASRITEWAPLTLPGLVQTPDYARHIMTRGTLTADQIDHRLSLRMARSAAVLRVEDPVPFHVLIGDPAIRGTFGGPAVMRRQLQHLLEFAEHDSVTLQAVKIGQQWHHGNAGAFILYEFPNGWPSIVYCEGHVGSSFHVTTAEVRETRDLVIPSVRARENALSPEDSRLFITRALCDLESSTA